MESSSENLNRQDMLSLLQWYMESGVDETIEDEPLDWFSQSAQSAAKPNIAHPAQPPHAGDKRPVSASTPRITAPSSMATVEQLAQEAEALSANCSSLDHLLEAIKSFEGCNLKKTAAHTIFADGNRDSHIMVIGEAPGVDDDRQGKPFAGETGQLLDRMFHAIERERQSDYYVSTLLPWRPPGNRKPTPEEITICLPFIKRHIELFNPEMIILLGGVATTGLLQTSVGITRLRGKWMEYRLNNKVIPVRPLYHPAYLLQQPKHKKDTWHDLLEIKAKLKELAL